MGKRFKTFIYIYMALCKCIWHDKCKWIRFIKEKKVQQLCLYVSTIINIMYIYSLMNLYLISIFKFFECNVHKNIN